MVLDGRYRVDRLLGRGGMGDVYVGEDTRLKRKCALKVLHATLAADRTNVERFLREAQMIASLDHPNIVDIYSYGEEPSGIVFFAMELLEGEDLDARLRARAERPFSIHDCCAWALQIAQAVTVVHEAGLIHRDLKTSNVFLARKRDGEQICKLLDFGIARAEDSSELTKTGVALGTPSYMSPEQIRNVGVDRRSDIYSFGVLLFKLLVGQVPFTGEPIQVAMAHCESPVPIPSLVAQDAGISPALDAIVLKAMAKRPADRYASMREVEAALVAVLQAEAPELAPVSPKVRIPTQQVASLGPPSAPPPSPGAEPTALLDAATPGPSPKTGATIAQPAASPSPSRWLFVMSGASLLGAAALFAALVAGGRTPPPAVEPPGPQAAPAEPRVATVSPTQAESVGPARLAPTPSERAPSTSSGVSDANPPAGTNAVPASPPKPVEANPSAASTSAPKSGQPPAKPASAPLKKRASTPATKPPAPAKPPAPLAQVEAKAKKCREKFKAVGGPKITIDFAVGTDGQVTRWVPSVHDELGKCLAEAVASTTFEPKLEFGRKVAL